MTISDGGYLRLVCVNKISNKQEGIAIDGNSKKENKIKFAEPKYL